MDVPVAAADQYREQAKFYSNGSIDYLQINLNTDNRFLTNKNFQKALSDGLSRENVITMARAGVSRSTANVQNAQDPKERCDY